MRSDERRAVIVGASGMVGRHLLRRLADRGVAGQCLTRRAVPASPESPPGFSWSVLSGDGELRVPPDAALFSLAPIAALPPLIARLTGGRRLVALSTASVTYKADSSDPAERAAMENVRRAESEVGRLCRERGIAWTILRPTLIYDPGRDRNVSAIAAVARRFRFVPVAWPASGRRQPIHADDVAQAMVAALDAPGAADAILGLPGGETSDLPRHGPPDFRGPGAAPRPALPAARTCADGFQGMEDGDGRGLQPRNAGKDEHGPDLRSGSRAGNPGDDMPALPSGVSRMKERTAGTGGTHRRRARGRRAD